MKAPEGYSWGAVFHGASAATLKCHRCGCHITRKQWDLLLAGEAVVFAQPGERVFYDCGNHGYPNEALVWFGPPGESKEESDMITRRQAEVDRIIELLPDFKVEEAGQDVLHILRWTPWNPEKRWVYAVRAEEILNDGAGAIVRSVKKLWNEFCRKENEAAAHVAELDMKPPLWHGDIVHPPGHCSVCDEEVYAGRPDLAKATYARAIEARKREEAVKTVDRMVRSAPEPHDPYVSRLANTPPPGYISQADHDRAIAQIQEQVAKYRANVMRIDEHQAICANYKTRISQLRRNFDTDRETIAIQHRRVKDLNGELRDLKEQMRTSSPAVQEEVEVLRKALAEVMASRDGWRTTARDLQADREKWAPLSEEPELIRPEDPKRSIVQTAPDPPPREPVVYCQNDEDEDWL